MEECLQWVWFSWRLGCGLQTGCWLECSFLWGVWGRRWRSKCSWHPGWSRLRWARLSLCSSGRLELSDGLEQYKHKETIKSGCISTNFSVQIPDADTSKGNALSISQSTLVDGLTFVPKETLKLWMSLRFWPRHFQLNYFYSRKCFSRKKNRILQNHKICYIWKSCIFSQLKTTPSVHISAVNCFCYLKPVWRQKFV